MDLWKGNPMTKPQISTPAVAATGATTVWTNGPIGPPTSDPKGREIIDCTPHLKSSRFLQQQEDIRSQ